MQPTKPQIKRTVYASIPRMPVDVCGIITDYVVRRPHAWNAVGLPESIATTLTASTTELRLKHVDHHPAEPVAWHAFVSESTLADGDLSWNVDFETAYDGWTGVGLTARPANHQTKPDDGYCLLAGPDDWILLINCRGVYVFQNNQDVTMAEFDDTHPVRRRVWFSADPTTGVVRMRFRLNGDGIAAESKIIDLITQKPRPSFASMRPCVVMSGRMRAVVRSEPAVDVPDDCLDLPIFVS